MSRSLKSVGPNATLVGGDIEAAIRGLKAQLDGELQVGGPDLAQTMTDLGLIDESGEARFTSEWNLGQF